MQDKLNKARNHIMLIMDETGGDKFISDIKDILYQRFLDNPFSEFLTLDFCELKDLDVMVKKAKLIMKNCYNKETISENLVFDYVRLKLEHEGFYSILVKDKDCIKVKI